VELSPRQREILEFRQQPMSTSTATPRRFGRSAARSGLTSPSTVHAHLARLESAGLIRRDPTKHRRARGDRGRSARERSTVVIERCSPPTVLPLMGDVAAARPGG